MADRTKPIIVSITVIKKLQWSCEFLTKYAFNIKNKYTATLLKQGEFWWDFDCKILPKEV